MVAIRAAASPAVEIEYVEKDLLMGPVAVVAVTHSLLYWPVEGQEEDLGTIARSCWEERTKEAVVKGRRTDSAGRRISGRIPLALVLAGLLGIPLLPYCRACDAKVPVPISPLQNPDIKNQKDYTKKL